MISEMMKLIVETQTFWQTTSGVGTKKIKMWKYHLTFSVIPWDFTFVWSTVSFLSATIEYQNGIGLDHDLVGHLAGDN